MGQRAIFLSVVLGSACSITACSIIYNPNNIPKPAPPDTPPPDAPPMPDANPAALMLTSVDTPALMEGAGSDGSHAEVLVVRGQNLIPDAQVTITAMDGSATPMVSLAGSAAVSSDHTLLAVPVESDVNTTCPAAGAGSGSIVLVITVTQSGGAVMQTIPWTLTCLPEIDQSGTAGSNVSLPTGVNEFSRFVLAGTATIKVATGANLAQPLIVRATGNIVVPGAISVSASSATEGPGGSPPATGDGKGGAGGSMLLGVLGSAGGGGAGYAATGADGTSNSNSGGHEVGSASIPAFASNYASGGGAYDSTLGGGGGGTIELTAGGSLSVHGISATGGQGGGNAGGGAGGTIVLRAGTTVTLDANLDISGGPANGQGGAGSVGRVRINTPEALQGSGTVFATGASPSAYRGLAFDPATPYITSKVQPTLMIHGATGQQYTLYTRDSQGNVNDTESGTFGADTANVSPKLTPGFNKLCLVEPGSDLGKDEAVTCVQLAYVP